MDAVAEWGRAFGVRGDIEALTRVYRDALGHLPAWALASAVRDAMTKAQYTSYPLPRAVLDCLPALWGETWKVRNTLWGAVKYGREADLLAGEQASPEDLERAIAAARKGLLGPGNAATGGAR